MDEYREPEKQAFTLRWMDRDMPDLDLVDGGATRTAVPVEAR